MSFFRVEATNFPHFYQSGEEIELYQIWGDIGQSSALSELVLDFTHIAPFLNAGDSNWTIETKFLTYQPRKNKGMDDQNV